MLYAHVVATCEWNCGDKGESGWYFEYILEALQNYFPYIIMNDGFILWIMDPYEIQWGRNHSQTSWVI